MMRVIRIPQIMILCCTLFSVFSYASVSFDKQEITKRFEKIGLKVHDVVPSQDIDGLLEVSTSNGTIFSTPNGKLFIAGTLFKLHNDGKYEDVIAKRLAPVHAKKIEALKDQMVEFKAKDEKYAVTVFTDITCGYCVRLHSQIKEYNDLGITIRYLAFPRQGGKGQVADNMAAVWCADDPQKALEDAKVNRKLVEPGKNIEKCKTMINNQFELGKELGVKGTPAIFLPNGVMVGGYLPPKALLKRLESL